MAGNFCFAKDHRIKAAGDSEEMTNGGLIRVDIDMRGNIQGVAGEQGRQPGQIPGVIGLAVKLDPVAGGDEDQFGKAGPGFQPVGSFNEPGRGYGQLLA